MLSIALFWSALNAKVFNRQLKLIVQHSSGRLLSIVAY